MSKFQYQGRSEDTVNRRIADRGGDFDTYLKIDPMKVSESENIFRILPPTWNTKGPWGDNWAIDVYLHWDVGADKGTYLCARKMNEIDPKVCPEDRCPVCEMLEDLDDDDIKKRLKAKRSLLAYVIDRKDEKAGPQVWRLGKQLEGNLQFRSKDKKTGASLPIDHPERGYDISFNRVGNDEKTKYINESVERDSSYISDDEKLENKWLDYITDHPLPEQLNFYSYDHIAKVTKGKSARKTSDDDAPSRTPRTRGGRSEEPAEETDRRDRRPAREEAEERPSRTRGGRDEPKDEEPDRASNRSSTRDEPTEEVEETPPRRPSRADPEEAAPRERSRPQRQTSVDEDEIPSERPSRRAAPKVEEDEGEQEPEEERGGTTSRAKASLARLKPRGK